METVMRTKNEMKDSRVEWAGLIPKDWKSIKFKYLYSVKKAKMPSELFEDNSLIPYMSIDYIRNPSIQPIYAKEGDFCSKEDVLLLWDGSNAGEFIIIHPEGYAPSTTAIIKLKQGKLLKSFSDLYLKSLEMELKNNTKGMGIPHVNGEFLKNCIICTPSYSEQQVIADYLYEKCSKIDDIIAETKASIEEYKELKQAVIFEAVTKGLNKNVEMKESCVEGMGLIPQNWSVVRFIKVNYVRARLGWKGLKAEEYVDEGIPFLSAFNIINNHLRWNCENYITQERYDESPEIKLNVGDLVLVKDGAGIGKCARIDNMPLGKATVNSSLSVITPSQLVDYRYEYYYFMSPLFQNIIARLKSGMGVPHLTQESMKDIYLPCPPINDQIEIAELLDDKVIELDSIISEKQSLINDLESYKKSLIYEVVTGKRKVV